MSVYFNEIDPIACAVLRGCYSGYVDQRSIKAVEPMDLWGFRRAHFFGGAGLWEVACRMAGWPAEREIWTASCPCQGESVAGKKLGADDPRHLWPDLFRLVRACRPAVLVGEQVDRAAGTHWLDGVWSDLEGEGYAFRAVDLPACAVDAPHRRNRIYWVAVADANGDRRSSWQSWNVSTENRETSLGKTPTEYAGIHDDEPMADAAAQRSGWRRLFRPGESEGPFSKWSSDQSARSHDCRTMADSYSIGRSEKRPGVEERVGFLTSVGASIAMADADGCGRGGRSEDPKRGTERRDAAERADDDMGDVRSGSYWGDAEWLQCADGKARRSKPGLRLLVDGLPRRADLWRLAGNAIVAPLAAEVLMALLETIDG